MLVIWVPVVALAVPAPTSTKHSGTNWMTKFCSKAVKLFVIAPSHIITERRWCAATVNGRLLSQSTLMEVNLTSQNDKFYPPRDAIPHSLTSLWAQFAKLCYRSSVWMYNIRLEAFPSICWGRFMYMWRTWFHGGEVDESATLLVLLVIVGEPKGFPPIEMAAIHILPFFRTYPGRTEWDSAPMCRNWRVNIDNLIVASFPTPNNLPQILGWPKKEDTY